MRTRIFKAGLLGLAFTVLFGCAAPATDDAPDAESSSETAAAAAAGADTALAQYASVRLTANLSHLSPRQREMITLLIEASRIMDELFWLQAYGEPVPLLNGIDDPELRQLARINYGPW